MSDSDDSDDSDYVPDKADDVSEGAREEKEVEETLDVPMTKARIERKRKIDDLWEEMKRGGSNEGPVKSLDSLKKKPRKGAKKAEGILASIFGKQNAKAMLEKSKAKETSSTAGEKKTFKAISKVTLTEKYRYAGKEIVIEKKVDADVAAKASVKKEKKGLDKLLDDLQGPGTLSTVGKSHLDWEAYKQEKGIEEDLQVATKDGYLHRKDFLERCDYRQFEQERDARMAKLERRTESSSHAPSL